MDSEQIPEKSQKRKSLLHPPEKTPKGFRTDQKKILGFVWENSSVLRLFPAFPTAFPGRRQSQELHHLLQRYLPNQRPIVNQDLVINWDWIIHWDLCLNQRLILNLGGRFELWEGAGKVGAPNLRMNPSLINCSLINNNSLIYYIL